MEAERSRSVFLTIKEEGKDTSHSFQSLQAGAESYSQCTFDSLGQHCHLAENISYIPTHAYLIIKSNCGQLFWSKEGSREFINNKPWPLLFFFHYFCRHTGITGHYKVFMQTLLTETCTKCTAVLRSGTGRRGAGFTGAQLAMLTY